MNQKLTPADDSPDRDDAVVRCVGVSKYFGAARALHQVSLALYPGEVTCLVGDNGAGKSTLVKVLSGIHTPDAGEVWIGDDRVTHFAPRSIRDLGIETVYQHLALCDNLGAAANVMLGQEPVRFRLGPFTVLDQRKALREAEHRIGAIVGVELADLEVPVRRLSGGQRQAVAIARATVRGHRLIMFDEPTAALGVRQTRATLALVRRIADQGVAALMISHNLDDIFRVGDRIVAMRLGKVTLDVRAESADRQRVVAAMTGLDAWV